jgi:superfamily II RNA helicase
MASTGMPLTPPAATPPIQAPEPGEEVVQLSEDQQRALNFVEQDRNVFITGRAGCGKSMVLTKAIGERRNKGKRVRIVAPTGKAACNSMCHTPRYIRNTY